MGISHSLRRINYSHAVLIAGLVVALLAVMFRPSGAIADLPTRANVYVKYDDSDYASVDLSSLSKVTRDYDVIPTNKSKSVSSSLTGVPLVDFLKSVGTDLENVGFVKVRLNVGDDSRIALVPLGESDAERPPIVLASGRVGSRSLGTPALVPGQPDAGTPIRQDNIVGFSKSKPYIQIIPSKPGAKLISVKINKKKKSSGQYSLSASIMNGSGAPAKYQWFQTDAKGDQTLIGSGKSVTTSATGTKDVVVNVVVTETSTGSTGQQYMSYIPKSKDKGSTSDPGTGTGGSGSGSGGGNGSGTGTGNGAGNGAGAPGSINSTPTPYTPPSTSSTNPPTQQPVNPSIPAPTPSTGTATVDTSAITNVAQNVSGTGGLKTVTGVLLSSPTSPASGGGGGGTPLSALPAPVADQLNSIFKPVDSTDDVWAYLLAILFAFSISGAVREWVKP